MVLNTRNIFSSFTSTSSWFEVYAAFSTFMMLLRTTFNDLVPQQFRSFIVSKLEAFFNSKTNNHISIQITKYWDNDSGDYNELFDAVQEYLPTRITRTFKSLKLGKLRGQKHLDRAVDASEVVVDEFEGTKFTWKLDEGSDKDPRRYREHDFVLTFNEKNRERVFDRYIPHVLKTYEAMKAERRVVRIHSWLNQHWNGSDLSHPATFDTLALDPKLKL